MLAFHKPMQYPVNPANKANQEAPMKAPVGLNGLLTVSPYFAAVEFPSVLFCSGSMFILFW